MKTCVRVQELGTGIWLLVVRQTECIKHKRTYCLCAHREGGSQGWSTVLITALDSWGKLVPRGPAHIGSCVNRSIFGSPAGELGLEAKVQCNPARVYAEERKERDAHGECVQILQRTWYAPSSSFKVPGKSKTLVCWLFVGYLLAICWLFVDYLLAIRLGTCECGVCKGSGMNNEDMDIPDQDQLLHTNAVRPDLYDKQGQCWFCR
jgi:hypothetical protein